MKATIEQFVEECGKAMQEVSDRLEFEMTPDFKRHIQGCIRQSLEKGFFVEEEEENWSCPECGGELRVDESGDRYCSQCGLGFPQ